MKTSLDDEILDARALLDRCLGQIDFAESLLNKLGVESHRYLEKIETAMREEDFEAVAETAHALRGAAGIVCASGLRNLAGSIEDSVNTQISDDLVSKVASLRSEIERFSDSLSDAYDELHALIDVSDKNMRHS